MSQRPLDVAEPDLSVVIPLHDEAENVGVLARWVHEALSSHSGSYEVILVDDGSADTTWDEVRRAADDPRVHGIRLRANVGQTAAMMAGFDHARGRVVVSMDGDLQNDPRDIPVLAAKLNEGYDLACGWRQHRQDSLFLRRIPSQCANRLIRWITGVPITDNGCSLKAYRKELLDVLVLYADQHRFIPALAASLGARIVELPVRHHPRRFGMSKYGISRTFKVLIDLLTLKMVTTFRARPLLGFGVAAVLALSLSLVFGVAAGIAWFAFRPEKAYALVLPSAAALWSCAALYFVMLGLIAEVAVRSDSERTRRPPLPREFR